MKRIVKSFAIAAVSALAFISCSQEQNPVSKDNGIHFSIRTSENPQVKSFIESNLDGTYTPKWSKGDELAMFVGTINDKSKPTATLTNSNEKGLTAKFDGQVAGIEGNGTFKSFAPARAFATGYSNGNVGITLAETQKPSSLTIDEACDILVGKETTYLADAAGEVAIDDLFFKRMFSVVKVALKGPASLNGEKVSKFSLTAPEGTVLTGRAAIDLTTATIDKWNISNNSVTATYSEDAPMFGGEAGLENEVWLVVNPGIIESGAKVVFAGETANYTFSKEVTLSKALTFPESQLAVINLTLAEENCTKKEVPAPASWIATDLADITATDEVVITMAKGESVYAMTSDNGTKNPSAVAVTVKDGELSATPADNLVWNIANDNGNLTIYPNGQTDKWLCAVDGKTDVKVSNSTTTKIFTLDATTKYLKNTKTTRYLGVSLEKSDWRAYASATGTSAIAGQTLCFYVKGTPKTALETPANLQVSAAKVVSWDAVNGAASYELTIGKDVFTSETNSYDATAVVDDYYDVAVVAVPSDKDNYKNSAAAILTGVKFGTPKLNTPELAEGAIDETSIRVNMTADDRATNGCTCEIYNGETLVESKTIKVNYVVFSGLESGVTYTIKVNAIAVDGEKPYAASDVASIELKTKPAQHVSDVTATGTYTIKGLTVYAVANPSVAIAGDNTGYILVYKSSHGLKVGNTFNVAGTVKDFNGVWEFDNPSITGTAAGETPVYPDTIEADEAYLASYGTATKIEYVHAKGVQSGKNIKVGTKTLYLSAENAETDGKNVEVTGFVYGYNTKFSSASFVATSIQLDDSFPYLSVDQSSKVWAADATNAFVVKVAVNSEADWTVTPETLSWATVAVDKAAGTIKVTPNGPNTKETANEATLTVTHASDASLTKEISLKQNGTGEVMPISFSITGATVKSGTVTFKAAKGNGSNDPKVYNNLLRLYAKNTITIEDSANPISKIEIEFVKQGSNTYIETLTADSGTVVSGGKSKSDKTPVTDTWTTSTTPTKKVVFTLGTSGQRVIKSVKVYF